MLSRYKILIFTFEDQNDLGQTTETIVPNSYTDARGTNVCFTLMFPSYRFHCPAANHFQTRSHFKTSGLNYPTWPWIPGQKYFHFGLPVFQSPIFYSVLLYGQPLSSYISRWDKWTEWPQITLNNRRSKVRHICASCTAVPEDQFVAQSHPFKIIIMLWRACHVLNIE